MPEHDLNCPQAPSIHQIGLLVSDMKRDMAAFNKRQEKRDDMLIEALRDVANQDARLDSQQAQIKHIEHDTEALFARVRDIEEAFGKDGATIELKVQAAAALKMEEAHAKMDLRLEQIIKFVNLISSWPALAIATTLAVMTTAGVFLDFWYHFDGVKQLWAAWQEIR
ncbi:MAG: hypothetical protein A2Y38_12130 [Spirochaetes bacterium GWB1_59_5]|nr:MAG: hypothetical protein A2Y38_12130 [Spirochaetes bacterium GWB1_59_5]